jgi:hypothetical protein
MDLSSLNRVVNAVGDKFIPDNLNKSALREGLEWCAEWRHTAAQGRLSKLSKHKFSQLGKIQKVAKRLALLLSDDYVWLDISAKLPLQQRSPRDAVNDLVKAVGKVLKQQRVRAGAPIETSDFAQRSPFEWLVGEHLPELFNRHFARRARLSRNQGRPDGPYIRFAERVLLELEIKHQGRPYTREAIARALTATRKGLIRRRRNRD